MKWIFIIVLFCASGVFAEGLPDIADSSQEAMSPADERTLGEETMRNIRADPAFLDDVEVVQYLNDFGSNLAQNAGANRPFEFFLIQDSTVNAFALPGGFIGVHTGLLLTAESESELASVLSHEIAHVTQRHLARMIADSKGSSITSLAALAVAILAAKSNSQATEAALATASANSIQSQLNFTREHEQEADRIGLQILKKSGYDVRAMPVFFERLQKSSRFYENNAPAYLRTHPLTSDRIADIQNRIQDAPYKQVLDSPDFRLLKDKILANQGNPREALSYFEISLKEKKYASEAAHRYGLAVAYTRTDQYKKAEKELAAVRKLMPPNAIVETLEGKIKAALSDNPLDFYKKAYATFPEHKALLYDYAKTLIDAGQANSSLKLIGDAIAQTPRDHHLYALQAQSYASEGKSMLQHQAQAQAYYLQGNVAGAIEQLQIAKKSRDGDFYVKSSVEARLKELMSQMEEKPKKKRKNF